MKAYGNSNLGFTLLEIATALLILAIMAALLIPLASTLMNTNRAGQEIDELGRIYKAIVGDPTQNNYGYIGDLGFFPSSLIDLVQKPASNNTGWRGPYLTDAKVQNGVILDTFGSPLECYYFTDPNNPAADLLAIISRGPDHLSNSNAATNVCGTAANASAANYAALSGNADNIVYPRFIDNPGLLTYQHLGTIALNIQNFDDNPLVATAVPGCPYYWNITITPTQRPGLAADTYTFPFAPGAASIDVPQGLYQVVVASTSGLVPVWQEQVAVAADATTSRNLTLAGLNSANTANLSAFQPNNGSGGVNGTGVVIKLLEFNSALVPTVAIGGQGNYVNSVKPCQQVTVQNNATAATLDAFIMPNLTNYNRIENANSSWTLTMTNTDSTASELFVYDQNMIIGTITNRGIKKQKVFLNVRFQDTISTRTQAGAVIDSFSKANSVESHTIF